MLYQSSSFDMAEMASPFLRNRLIAQTYYQRPIVFLGQSPESLGCLQHQSSSINKQLTLVDIFCISSLSGGTSDLLFL
jgi:hypothetical protein